MGPDEESFDPVGPEIEIPIDTMQQILQELPPELQLHPESESFDPTGPEIEIPIEIMLRDPVKLPTEASRRSFLLGEPIPDNDVETHYDLAVAYIEMGALEDAVAELEQIQASGEREVEVLSLLATCKLRLGSPHEGSCYLREALAIAGYGHPATLALHYELGAALIAAGKATEALQCFRAAASADPDYRDVQEQIRALLSSERTNALPE